MVHVAPVHQHLLQPRLPDGIAYLPVGLAAEAYAQLRGEERVRSASVSQYLPECQRIAVGGEETRVGEVEESVLPPFHKVVLGVISVGDEFHRGGGHATEFIPDRWGHRDHPVAAVKHPPLEPLVLLSGECAQAHMLEIEHPGPGIPEVRHPFHSGAAGEFHRYQVHRMRRAGAHDRVHGVFPEIVAEEPYRGLHPARSRVRDEQIAPRSHCQFLEQAFFLMVDGVYLGTGRFSGQLAVETVNLVYGPAYHFHVLRHVLSQCQVDGRGLRVLRGVYDALPAFSGQVLAEFHPPLDSGTA